MKERKKQLKKEGKPTSVEEDDPEVVSLLWGKPPCFVRLGSLIGGLKRGKPKE